MVEEYSRRQFIQKKLSIGIGMVGLFWLSCHETGESGITEGTDSRVPPCDNFSGLSEDELKPRLTFGYVEVSPLAENRCNNCQLWLPNKDDNSCGKCQLFKGPVRAEGHCTYWAPQG